MFQQVDSEHPWKAREWNYLFEDYADGQADCFCEGLKP